MAGLAVIGGVGWMIGRIISEWLGTETRVFDYCVFFDLDNFCQLTAYIYYMISIALHVSPGPGLHCKP